MQSRYLRVGAGLAVTIAGLVAAYVRLVRPWQMHWGASRDEVERALP